MKKSQINKLDELWSNLVKENAGHKCEHCGIQGVRMEAAHVVGRRHRATRWGYFRNSVECVGAITIKSNYDLCGHCFCHNCHQQYDEHGPLEGDIVTRTVGLARKEEIQKHGMSTVAKSQDYEQIKKVLEEDK